MPGRTTSTNEQRNPRTLRKSTPSSANACVLPSPAPTSPNRYAAPCKATGRAASPANTGLCTASMMLPFISWPAKTIINLRYGQAQLFRPHPSRRECYPENGAAQQSHFLSRSLCQRSRIRPVRSKRRGPHPKWTSAPAPARRITPRNLKQQIAPPVSGGAI